MAPEFWHSELNYTNAVDMWSWEIVAVELLTAWDTTQHAWGWRSRPSVSGYRDWITNKVHPRIALAPEKY